MKVSRSGYYKFLRAKPSVISAQQMQWEADFKALFYASQQSYGTRRMAKGMRQQGYSMGRYQARTLMKKLGLQVKTKRRFQLTTEAV